MIDEEVGEDGSEGLEALAAAEMGRWTRFFIWCAGSDPDLLGTSAERTKHIGLGTLVLVPAVLACFAMTYALSTLSPHPWVYIAGGMAWALVVFAFDRYVVSTFRKTGSPLTDLTSPVFLTRFLLAGFVGIIVAHPLVLLYFQASLDEQLEVQRLSALQEIEATYGPQFEAIEKAREGMRHELQAKESVRLGAQELLMAEISGVPSEKTTGRYGRGPAAKAREELRQLADEDLNRLQRALDKRSADLEAQRQDLIARRQDERDAPQARDYIARSRAMAALRTRSPEVARVHAFLLLFFVFVDTLPLLFKVMTARGPYDDRLALEEQRAFAVAEKERTTLVTVYQEMDRARSSASARREAERRGLPVLFGELLNNLERHQQAVRASLKRELAARGDGLNEVQEEAQREALARIDAANLQTVARTVEQFEEAFLGAQKATPDLRPSVEPSPDGLTA